MQHHVKTPSVSFVRLHIFKFEVANEIGVDLKEGYNGHLTTAQAGSVGGEMVRKMIRRQEEEMSR